MLPIHTLLLIYIFQHLETDGGPIQIGSLLYGCHWKRFPVIVIDVTYLHSAVINIFSHQTDCCWKFLPQGQDSTWIWSLLTPLSMWVPSHWTRMQRMCDAVCERRLSQCILIKNIFHGSSAMWKLLETKLLSFQYSGAFIREKIISAKNS